MKKLENPKLAVGRRDFFKGTAASAAALVAARGGGSALIKGAVGGAAALAASSAGNALANGVAAYTLTASAVTLLVGGGKTVNAYAYNGTVPGPTLRARAGDTIQITVVNSLPAGVDTCPSGEPA